MAGFVEIFFSDLNAETQIAVLEAAGVESAEEMNWDVFPLFDLDFDHPTWE